MPTDRCPKCGKVISLRFPIHDCSPFYVCLVYFNVSVHRLSFLIHEATYLLEHSPSCLVGNSKLTLKLFSRDTTSGARHQKYGMKPVAERSSRLVKYRASRRGYRVTTELTDVIFSSRPMVELRYLLALRAVNAVRVSALEYAFKASIIGRILLIEVFNRILISFHFSPLTNKYSTKVTVCQGIVT